MLAHSFLIKSSSKLLVTRTGIKARIILISGLWFPWPIYMFLKWDLTLAHWTQVSDRCPLGYLLYLMDECHTFGKWVSVNGPAICLFFYFCSEKHFSSMAKHDSGELRCPATALIYYQFCYILFTKSRGYLDIKNCSTYKSIDTHLNSQFWLGITACKFHPGTWFLDHTFYTRVQLPIFTWIWHGDRMFQDVGIYTETLAIVHFSSWKFVLHTVSWN